MEVDSPKNIQLLMIVEVDHSQRIYCQAENCKSSVFKEIHVVREDHELKLYGSSCFAKKYNQLPPNLKSPLYQSHSTGAVLTAEERQMLTENTEKLLEKFRQRFEENERIKNANEAKEKLKNDQLLLEKLEAARKFQQEKDRQFRERKSNIAVKSIRPTDRFDEHALTEIRAFELECQAINPNFNETQLMRSMWAKDAEIENAGTTIRDYWDGANRTRVIDVVIRQFSIKTSTDPWGFAVQLLSHYSIPKIVTFQVLSDFGLLRVAKVI